MSSFAREAPKTSTAASDAAVSTTASASTTTTTTSAPTAAANGRSGDSPRAIRATGSAAKQSSSSDGSSPLGCLPAVLRPPISAAGQSVQQSTTSAAATQSQSPQQQNLPTPTASRLYASQSLAGYSGDASPMQMQPQYYAEGGRLASGPSSYGQQRSPVSSPAMAGDAWAQSQSTTATAMTAASLDSRGAKRHLQQQQQQVNDGYGRSPQGAHPTAMRLPQQQPASQNASGLARSASSTKGSSAGTSIARQPPMQQIYGTPPNEDPMQYEPSGEARHPRDSTRYETWTSKQLRKKCSHLKLRGLKNVKKHVMVEALYRYYRNQRQKETADVGGDGNSVASQPPSSPPQQQPQPRRLEARHSSVSGNSTGGRPDLQYRSRYEQRPVQQTQAHYASRPRNYGNYGSQSPSPPSSGGDSGGQNVSSNNRGYYLDEESKGESQFKEVPVTSEDVIRLVDVVLSPDFVDRLAAELSRWQFWVDVREMYIALLNRQYPLGSTGNNEGGPVSTGGSATNSRNFKWSSMQLWEIWKELSFAYTKTCFEFTTAGVDDREYINFCDGRPDVYYLHQRLHARPDLLHLIKSNEYIDEKCTSVASESIVHEQQQAQQQQQPGPLVGSGSPMLRSHKRYKRSGPVVGNGAAYNNPRVIAAYRAANGPAGVDGAATSGSGNSRDNASGRGSGDSRGHSPEENSTENSETTGEEGSSNAANSNASNSSGDVLMRTALAEQKYFGLLLQNFEVIFESLHNKKVLLATLRKDNQAPDHMIADLHDDIHVLSALKKEFRNKLRRTMP